MPSPSMTRTIVHHESTGRTRRIAVSLPRISALEGDPSYTPEPADTRPVRHRNPSMQSLVKLALKMDNAEQLGLALNRRFDRRKQRRD